MVELMNVQTVTQLRESKGWTRLQLAARADISPRTLRSLERGATVSRKSMEAVCRALGVKPGEVQGVQVRQAYYSRTGE